MSFENKDDRTSFSKYYTPTAEIKDFNVVIDDKSFFDVPIENKEKTYEKLLKREIIMIIQLVVFWIMNIFQNIMN